MDFTNLKLDTRSEYIVNEDKRSVNVMVEGLEDYIKPLFIKGNNEPEYIDTYVNIDSVLEVAISIEFVAKYFNNTQDSIVIKLDNDVPTEAAGVFYTIMAQDEDGALEAALKEAKDIYHVDRAERVGCIIDTFNDFLEMKDIYIPTSVREMVKAGNSITENGARIYGSDYDKLNADVKIAIDEDNLAIAEKWWIIHFDYAVQSAGAVDEVDFVNHAITDYGITGDFILYRIQDLEACQWFRKVAEEHGLI